MSARLQSENGESEEDEPVIHVTDGFDRMYWRKRLHVSDETLVKALSAAGPKLANVQRYLKQIAAREAV